MASMSVGYSIGLRDALLVGVLERRLKSQAVISDDALLYWPKVRVINCLELMRHATQWRPSGFALGSRYSEP